MSTEGRSQIVSVRQPSRIFARAWFDAFVLRFPFVGLLGAIFTSSIAGSFFSFFYNWLLIIEPSHKDQKAAFWEVAAPIYNFVVYPLCFFIMLYLLSPMMRCLKKMRRGETVDPAFLQFCQRRLINLPIVQLIINTCAVLPGACFPVHRDDLWHSDHAGRIWIHSSSRLRFRRCS